MPLIPPSPSFLVFAKYPSLFLKWDEILCSHIVPRKNICDKEMAVIRLIHSGKKTRHGNLLITMSKLTTSGFRLGTLRDTRTNHAESQAATIFALLMYYSGLLAKGFGNIGSRTFDRRSWQVSGHVSSSNIDSVIIIQGAEFWIYRKATVCKFYKCRVYRQTHDSERRIASNVSWK